MKKIIGTFIFLLCVAAVVFFLGWTQFKVKPDSCGILVSKTGGVNATPIMPGKFSWNWEPLLPTNASLKIFSLKPTTYNKLVSSALPSSEIYSKMYAIAPDFSYKFDFSITTKVSAENIIALLKDASIVDSESLATYVDSACATLASKAATKIIEKQSLAQNSNATVFSTEELIDFSEAKKSFPHIEVLSFTCNSSHFPDIALYENAKLLFAETQKKLPEPVSQANTQNNASQNTNQNTTQNIISKNAERDKKVDALISELQQLKSSEQSSSNQSAPSSSN